MRLAAVLTLATTGWAQDAPNLARVDPPAAKVSVAEAVRGGVAFLTANQNRSGSFGTRTNGRPYNVTSAVPGGHYAFEAATTAICWMGLRDVGHQTRESRECADRALKWLVRNARVKRAHGGQLYNTWAFAYGLRALAQALRERSDAAPEGEIRAAAEAIVKAMEVYQTPDGGWGYYDFRTRSYKPSWSTSFSTATSLIALRHAEQAGVPVPVKVITKATGNLEICRKPDGTYLYGSYHKYAPMHRVNQPQGAAMRVPPCNLGLWLVERNIKQRDLLAGLAMFEEHQRFAIAGLRRPIPHESWYAVSGYFYLYGHMYAADTLAHVGRADRARFAGVIAKGVLKTRQPDGSFWDYPLYGYHKFYGTGYALMALARCERALAGTRGRGDGE